LRAAAPAVAGAGRTIVIGAGKASAAMAQALEKSWAGPLSGLVVTRYGYAVPCERIEIVEAAHPVPDEAGLDAARRIMELVSGLSADDTVICLISGGGSSLLPLPLEGITLEDKQAVNRALLASGATIGEMNCVRRHLSGIKGGRLAASLPSGARGHPADFRRAGRPSLRHRFRPDRRRPEHLRRRAGHREALRHRPAGGGARGAGERRGESVKPGDERLARCETRMIATPQMALEAAALVAREAGITPYILGNAIEGEARDVGKAMAGIALQVAEYGQPFARPCVMLSGGETTVTVRGQGRGGRNVEFLLSLGLALEGRAGIHALAGDTDGVDGQEEIAGAVLAPDTLERAWGLGIKPADSLQDNDGHGFFGALGDSVVTGPTLTNVNDFRAVMVLGGNDANGLRITART
jgi:glycerate 2-kinase